MKRSQIGRIKKQRRVTCMHVSSQSWPKRMTTRRSSSARIAWSTAHPEWRCGRRYDILASPATTTARASFLPSSLSLSLSSVYQCENIFREMTDSSPLPPSLPSFPTYPVTGGKRWSHMRDPAGTTKILEPRPDQRRCFLEWTMHRKSVRYLKDQYEAWAEK